MGDVELTGHINIVRCLLLDKFPFILHPSSSDVSSLIPQMHHSANAAVTSTVTWWPSHYWWDKYCEWLRMYLLTPHPWINIPARPALCCCTYMNQNSRPVAFCPNRTGPIISVYESISMHQVKATLVITFLQHSSHFTWMGSMEHISQVKQCCYLSVLFASLGAVRQTVRLAKPVSL